MTHYANNKIVMPKTSLEDMYIFISRADIEYIYVDIFTGKKLSLI